ncbi:hypothetical protein EJB05_32979, partial [Eragrostis curvula]
MPRRERCSLFDALAAARIQEERDSLPPAGRLSPVSPLTRCKTPTPSSSSGSSGTAVPRTPGVCPSAAPAVGGHRSSGSGASLANGSAGLSAAATSPLNGALPAGNICPSGRLAPAPPSCAIRRDVLRSGAGSYGHGSVVRGRLGGVGVAAAAEEDASVRRHAMDAEELRRAGNEQYRNGCFEEALRLYDRALAACPDSAACRGNRAAAFMGLGRLGEAVGECEEALRIDPSYGRARQRLISLLIRLGHFADARTQISLAHFQSDLELHKLETVEKNFGRCLDARKVGNWKSALRECDAAIAGGADSCALLFASRAESLLQINQIDEADLAICRASELVCSSSCALDMKFCGFLVSSYIYYVHAQVDMAKGRFDSALSSMEKASITDSTNAEVTAMLNIFRAVAQARSMGNELFRSGKYAEACIAYGEGLKHHATNPLGHWEKSIEDCNEALKILPNYTKAILRRAASYGKINRWENSVKDYEILRKELPGDTEVAEAHYHAQIALRSSREEASNVSFGGRIETR